MTIQWLMTSTCIKLLIPNLSFVSFTFADLTHTPTNIYVADFSHHWIVCHMHRPRSLPGYRQGPFRRSICPTTSSRIYISWGRWEWRVRVSISASLYCYSSLCRYPGYGDSQSRSRETESRLDWRAGYGSIGWGCWSSFGALGCWGSAVHAGHGRWVWCAGRVPEPEGLELGLKKVCKFMLLAQETG